jgi:hypothetical protein
MGRPVSGDLPASSVLGSPTVFGQRVTDLSATAGAVVAVGLVAARLRGWPGLAVPELFVAFATLVLVPLGLGVITVPDHAGVRTLFAGAVLVQPLAALIAVAGLTQSPGTVSRVLLIVPWGALTVVLAGCGLMRLRRRGPIPVTDLAVDAALVYLPVAGAFLLLHALEITFHFSPTIVLLTGVHFHYAGFVLPLFVGVVGTRLLDSREAGLVTGALRVGTLGVIGGIAAIAVAITLSPWLELPAVSLFVLAVVTVALVVLVGLVPSVSRGPAALLTVACVSLLFTMTLAFAYAYSVFPATGTLVAIPEMIRWHGTVNAVGFALPGLLAARLLAA